MPVKAKHAKATPMMACNWCGEQRERSSALEHWKYSHPASCPFRQDHMPAINGVHMGDIWQNLHVKSISQVVDLRLGGGGTYVDREATVTLVELWRPSKDVDDVLKSDEGHEQLALGDGIDVPPTLAELEAMYPDEYAWAHEHPLWSLVEHYEPLSRPGEYPVPWEIETSRFGYEHRSCLDEWRGGGHRHPLEPERDEKEHAYWHAWQTVESYSITNFGSLWMIPADEYVAPPAKEGVLV